MRGARAAGLAAAFLLALLPVRAVAQPDLWRVRQPFPLWGIPAAIEVVDARTGTVLRLYEAPPGVSIGSGVMSDDRRWYFASTNLGIARFDVPTRELVEIITSLGSMCGVSPGGRWIYCPVGASLQIIDPISRRIVGERPGGYRVVLGFMHDEWSLEAVLSAEAGRWDLQAWAGPDAAAPAWTLRSLSYRDVEVSPLGVYILFDSWVEDTALAEVVRYDPVTGTEMSRGRFSFTSTTSGRMSDIALSSGRVFLAGGDSTLPGRHFVAAFDWATLATLASNIRDRDGSDARLLVDGAGGVLLQLYHLYGSHLNEASWHRVDLDSLALVDLWSSADRASYEFEHLGDGVPPGAPRLTVAPSAGGGLMLDWHPDSRGVVPSGFEIHGAVAGQPLGGVARVAGDQRRWTSPPLPPGTYEVELVATNPVGRGAPSNRVAMSVGEPRAPAAPVSVTPDIIDDVLRLSWGPPSGGPVPAGYLIEAASQAGPAFSTVARVFDTEWRVSHVPAGAWLARVRAFTSGGVGPPSAAVDIRPSECLAAPSAPAGFAGLATQRVVTLQWSPPLYGSAGEYVIEAGSGPGLANLARLGTGGPAPFWQSAVPPGAYYLRIRARNACGESGPSNEVVLVVP